VEDNGDELEGNGLSDEDEAHAEDDNEDDAIVRENDGRLSPRENI
jgi:hypothetical protein